MNPLERTLIEKTGHDNGFEHTLAQDAGTVTLASARHRSRTVVGLIGDAFHVCLQSATPALLPELHRSFPHWAAGDGLSFQVTTHAELAHLLRRAASLSQALPSQAAQDYESAVLQELAEVPEGLGATEVERMVRQRLGQERFRSALMDYWGGACAVTEVTVPEVLRASHAKPWAECATDAERLDLFNGFLLTANLDALFDRFLISFGDDGRILIAPGLAPDQLQSLGVHPEMRLRWITDAHRGYLAFHRRRYQGNG